MNEVLNIQHLSKKYRKQIALDDVSLTLKQGEIYGLIGRNGAGKTTLLKAVTRLIQPTKGFCQLFGSQNEKEYIQNLERVGAIIEHPHAYEHLTVKQNFLYYAKLKGLPNEKEALDSLKLVGLTEQLNKSFDKLSLGMKQKFGIALALIDKPDLLLLDEPINGLDPIAVADFRKLIKELNETLGMTIIISSHILSELYHVATKFGILHNGQLLKEMTKADFENSCEESIHINVDDTELASFYLMQEHIDINFKVLDKHTIKVYDFQNGAAELNSLLVKNDVMVNAIFEDKTDLSTYFTQLIGENRD